MMAVADFKVSKWSAYKGEFCGYHRIIVIYETSEDAHFFVVTSQVDKARIRARYDEESLVFIDQPEWDQLTCPSCVECSKRNLKRISKNNMQKLYEAWAVKSIGEVPETVRKRIIDAINASVSYSEREKQIYTL
nr:MAG TPA: hypothetical protein [Caudoviricetes sp.]